MQRLLFNLLSLAVALRGQSCSEEDRITLSVWITVTVINDVLLRTVLLKPFVFPERRPVLFALATLIILYIAGNIWWCVRGIELMVNNRDCLVSTLGLTMVANWLLISCGWLVALAK